MDKVRVAIIGCGGISRAHVNAHMAEPRSDVIYCVDVNEELAREKAEAIGCKWHTDYEAILDEVDAVDICTPVHLHAPMTIRAAEAGKHVMCEKIMARTIEEAETMIEATDRAGSTPAASSASASRIAETICASCAGSSASAISLTAFISRTISPKHMKSG